LRGSTSVVADPDRWRRREEHRHQAWRRARASAAEDAGTLVQACDALLLDNRFPEFVTAVADAARKRAIPVVIDISIRRPSPEIPYSRSAAM